MKVIRGKKALITGAASGIGRSIALALADEGAALFLLDIDAEKLAAVVTEARSRGAEATGRPCDVGEPRQIDESIAAVIKAWGDLDILINNAGIAYYGDTGKMTDAQWDRLLAVNLHAPVLFIRRLLPLLLARAEAHIVNVCSIFGLIPKRKMAAYQTTKYALVGLSQSLRYEYGPRGLGVTTLCPGLVDTDLLKTARAQHWLAPGFDPPAFMRISPDVIAARAVRAIRRNKGLVVLTAHARLLWILYRLSPHMLDAWQHFKDRRKAAGRAGI
jgi:NAD(P)-dependent dehydrogenase (short-subunit alcohol dehydrogenase family)